MNKITTAVARRISEDWLTECPGFAVHAPLHLLKRSGPFLIGIYLEPTRLRDAYTPIAHLHNLGIPFPTVSLSEAIVAPLITVRGHEAGRWKTTAAGLIGACPTMKPEDVRVSDLGARHEMEATSAKYPVFFPYVPVFESLLVLALFIGDLDYAEAVSSHVGFKLREAGAAHGAATAESWGQRTRRLLTKPCLVMDTVRFEIIRHKVDKLPEVHLNEDAPLRRFW